MAHRRRAALTSGTIAGIRFAAKSFGPSLGPRSAVDQGIVTGGSFLTGFLVGSIAGRLTGMLPAFTTSPALRTARLLVSGIGSVQGLTARLLADDARRSATVGWAEMGSEVVGAIALAGLAEHAPVPAGRAAAAAAVAAGSVADIQAALSSRDDAPDTAYVLRSLGVAAAMDGAIAGLTGAVVLGARLAEGSSPSRLMRAARTAIGGVAVIGAFTAVGGFALMRYLHGLQAETAKTEHAFAQAPASSTVSGSRFSLAAYDTLGMEGRRLVSQATRRDVFVEVMGTPPVADPVRVYVGMETAETIDDRVELAVHELRRAGGFDRSMIVAASPTGTGYVNYIPIEAAELMALGDIATIAIQYGGLPSLFSMNRVDEASELYAKLIRRLRREIDDLGRSIQLVTYGESLGALTSQNGVRIASGSGDLVVDAALWVGTPPGSKLFEELTASGVPVYDSYDDYLNAAEPASDHPRVIFLSHDNDPVATFSPGVVFRMPARFTVSKPTRGTNPHERWLPGISWWQGMVDTKNAARVIPGEFSSNGHDYRADLAQFVRLAYRFEHVTDDDMARIEARVRESEKRRLRAVDRGTVTAERPALMPLAPLPRRRPGDAP